MFSPTCTLEVELTRYKEVCVTRRTDLSLHFLKHTRNYVLARHALVGNLVL
jgi:hypothetical protein